MINLGSFLNENLRKVATGTALRPHPPYIVQVYISPLIEQQPSISHPSPRSLGKSAGNIFRRNHVTQGIRNLLPPRNRSQNTAQKILRFFAQPSIQNHQIILEAPEERAKQEAIVTTNPVEKHSFAQLTIVLFSMVFVLSQADRPTMRPHVIAQLIALSTLDSTHLSHLPPEATTSLHHS